MIIIDLKEQLVGRVATKIAKAALLGNDVVVVNCKEAVISGTPAQILAKYKQQRDRGNPVKGPFLPRQSHLFVKRIIRGMIPYKKAHGAEAFKRIKCYAGTPEEYQGKETVTYKEASITKLPTLKYVTVARVVTLLGGKQ